MVAAALVAGGVDGLRAVAGVGGGVLPHAARRDRRGGAGGRGGARDGGEVHRDPSAGTPNCAASPTLAARLDAGLMLARQLPAAWVVVSGGEDFLRGCREADVMADYLLARGLAPIRLIREGRATSTDENLRFSRELLAQQGVPATEPVIVVTSDFHLMRAERIARKAGFTWRARRRRRRCTCAITPGCGSISR